MNFVAFKMLTGDRGKYLGMIFGLLIASFLIIQQLSIFCGLMTRTFGFLTDTAYPDLWVMDQNVRFIDDIKSLQDTRLYRIRGVEGVAWAVPMYKGLNEARLDDGTFQTCQVIGLDDASLIGGPARMVQGELGDLRQADGVIVDSVGAADKLAKRFYDAAGNETVEKRRPLAVGDTLELNDKRAVVVGICSVTRTFQSQPVIYTTYTRATTFAPRERRLLSFILAGTTPGQDPAALAQRIQEVTGLLAMPRRDFEMKTVWYYVVYTGIPINFGISVALGFIVGTAIAGLLFYQFTQDNIRHFGALKAMGAGNLLLLRMIVLQSLLVGFIGYGLGAGLAAFMGYSAADSELAFYMPWWVLAGGAVAVIIICALSAGVAIIKVIRLEPAIVFKG
ncbi:MAG TPA: ABC transporter permease [Tepidisphaeraceae bacterium]|jgi:putative ABC transport system permease protein